VRRIERLSSGTVNVALVYNAIVFLADLAFLFVVARKRKSWEVISVMTVCLLTAAVAGVVVGTHMFEALALYCYAVFLHGVICLAALGAMSWSAHRRTGAALLGMAALLLGIGFDAFVVEPHWLEVSRMEIRSDKVERPMKIVVIADIQTDNVGDYEADVLRRAMAEHPDLILLPGDYVQASGELRAQQVMKLRALLHEVNFGAPLGVFAVQGNTDAPGWGDIFRDLPVTTIPVTRQISTEFFDLTALSILDSGRGSPRVEATKKFHITMGHRPDFALGEVDSDLLVAGHTHGGQVRLPFFGPVMTLSNVPRSWAAGVTKLPGNRTLVVSRGIGMERGGAPELRFLCRPELVVLTIVPR
jgi:predicted MPP superfamily phosphohydrolase